MFIQLNHYSRFSNIDDSAELETEIFKERGLLEKKYKGINYESLIGLLIEGIKQLDREVRQLRRRLSNVLAN